MTAIKVPTEHEEQRAFVMWFRQNHKPVRIFAVPNGGRRSLNEATRLKAEGVSAGVPDLYIPEWNMWIEMKRQKGGALSEEQKDWRDYLLSIGHKWHVTKGAAEAIKTITEYLK